MPDPGRPVLPTYPEETRRKLARNVVQNSIRLRRGDNLLIETWSGTMDWASAFVLEARIAGARPMLVVEDEDAFWKSLKEARPADVGRVGSHDWAALKACDAYVYLYGPLDTAREAALPESISRRRYADDHEWFRLVAKHGIRSARWDLGRTSPLSAEQYGVSLDRWRQELIDGASVDPSELQEDGVRIARSLRKGREISITHPNGTDLTLRLAGRTPRVDDGIVDDADLRAGQVMNVLPSGCTTVTLDETYAEGVFRANIAGVMLIPAGETPLQGGKWEFRKGRLVRASFDRGEAEFQASFGKLGAGKDRPSLLTVGLNPRISEIPLLFDQEMGVITLAIGRNSHMGGLTKTPHFSVYQSIRGGTLRVDGRPIVEDGVIVR